MEREARRVLIMDCADLNLLFLVRMWRIMEWVSRVRDMGLRVLRELKSSRERT